MGKWIKQNLVLISGILLPVLLVAGFFVLSRAPAMLADPPEYDFILVGYHYDYQHESNYTLDFEVRDGHLTARAMPREGNQVNYTRQKARVFRYDATGNRFEEIAYDLPDGLDNLEEPARIELGAVGALKLDKRMKSPDGYEFEFVGYRGRGGLLGEIFGMRRHYESTYILKKDGAWFDLPEPSTDQYTYQYDLHFMGWVLDEGPAQ